MLSSRAGYQSGVHDENSGTAKGRSKSKVPLGGGSSSLVDTGIAGGLSKPGSEIRPKRKALGNISSNNLNISSVSLSNALSDSTAKPSFKQPVIQAKSSSATASQKSDEYNVVLTYIDQLQYTLPHCIMNRVI
jgi:hypothetical protein